MKLSPRLLIAILAAIAVVALAVWWLLRPAPLRNEIEASGRIEGRITVITPKTQALVSDIKVDEGQIVKADQLLLVLDDPALRARAEAAQENVAALTRRLQAADSQLELTQREVVLQIEQAQAALKGAHAGLNRSRATFAQAKRDADRAKELVARHFLSPQATESAELKAVAEENGRAEAEASLTKAEKQLSIARLGERQLTVMRAEREGLARQVKQMEALAAEQRSLVADFAIKSPLDGTVLTRTVELGERVNPGTPLFTLTDLNKLYLKIYIPEPQIGKIALNQRAEVRVDSYPGRVFAARVSKVAGQAEFTPKNVETKEERVKLVFAVELSLLENPDGILKPGMPADGRVFLSMMPVAGRQ